MSTIGEDQEALIRLTARARELYAQLVGLEPDDARLITSQIDGLVASDANAACNRILPLAELAAAEELAAEVLALSAEDAAVGGNLPPWSAEDAAVGGNVSGLLAALRHDGVAITVDRTGTGAAAADYLREQGLSVRVIGAGREPVSLTRVEAKALTAELYGALVARGVSVVDAGILLYEAMELADVNVHALEARHKAAQEAEARAMALPPLAGDEAAP